MEIKDILAKCDHTLLDPAATWDRIREICDDGIKYGTATVCIPQCFVKQAKEYVGDRLRVCTVIGFPNGNSTTETKVFETADAVKNGADEIDMVINIGMLRGGLDAEATDEIRRIKEACSGKLLKVIIETCLLTEDEKIRACSIVANGGADYIKTSTGFSKGGATREDVALLRKYSPASLKVKAAGGIATLQDAEDFINLGADRLGTSRVVKAVKALESGK